MKNLKTLHKTRLTAITLTALSLSLVTTGYAKSTHAVKSASTNKNATTKLPFIGSRYYTFELWGGNGGEKITINKNGDTNITYYGDNGSSLVYKGKYTNPIVMKEKDYTSYYKIQGNKIMQVDKNGNIKNDCQSFDGKDIPCIATLDKNGI